jgi:signal transduction histidine kinase
MTLARNIGFRLPSWRWPTARTVFVAATVWLAAAMPSVRSLGDDLGKADAPPLTTIAEVKATAQDEARPPVRVRGVLTFRIGEGFAIQDDSAGMWVEVTQARRMELLRSEMAAVMQLRPGDDIEVVGLADRGGYAPTILPVTVSKVGERPLPEPRPYDRNRFFLGLDDCLRVTVEGVVQGYRDDADNRRWNLLVGDCSRRFWVGVNKDSLAVPPATLVDSVVRCVGVASADFNTRRELMDPRLNVCRPEDFQVLEEGESDPFAAPEVPMVAIAAYPSTVHRVRTRGTVTYALPGNFLMIQQGSIGVRVGAASVDRYTPGDIVEVSGFASAATPVVGLIEAVVRRVGIVSPPEPMAIDPEKISLLNLTAAARFEVAKPGDYYGCLVTFPATVVDVHTTRAGGEVVLHTPEMGLSASADTLTFDKLRSLPTGAEVQVTGIVQPETVASDDPTATQSGMADGRMQILLRSAADIEVVRWPSWWTPRRLAALLGVVAACAATALMWVVMLRRQVARQLGVIERKLQGEAATEERHRIAREFHDTLEQDLAGIELQLDAAADMTDDDRCRPVLHRQRALLARLRQETHDFLWDLRDPVRIDGAIVESLAAQTAYLQSGTSVPITLHANDGIGRVPADIQFHLLRIVREAIHNAVRHSDPASVVVNIGTDGTGIAVEVIDDGHGFDVTAKQGLAGHFGLRGMAERAARIGAGLAVTSTPGSGTQVRVTVPLANDGEPTSDRIRFSG